MKQLLKNIYNLNFIFKNKILFKKQISKNNKKYIFYKKYNLSFNIKG